MPCTPSGGIAWARNGTVLFRRDEDGDVEAAQSWPVSSSASNIVPGDGHAALSPGISQGFFYTFDLNYDPEITIGLVFVDIATKEAHVGKGVGSSGSYQVEAPTSIPADDAAVGLYNPEDNARAIDDAEYTVNE